MVHKVKILRKDRGIVVLQPLEFSHLSNIPNRFYESPKLKNWMCELCTLSQIWSYIILYIYIYIYIYIYVHKYGIFIGYDGKDK